MISQTNLATQQCRLREWAEQIGNCQNRTEEISIIEWCFRNGLTKANYYYRLCRVKEACLEQFPPEAALHQAVSVPSEFLSLQGNSLPATPECDLELSLNGICKSARIPDIPSSGILLQDSCDRPSSGLYGDRRR